MNFCVLLLCISTSGIYLKSGTNKKEAIYHSLVDQYVEKIKDPSINNQNKITSLETEFKTLLFKDYLEVLEDWEIEKKVSYIGPHLETLPPTILLFLDNLRKDPKKAPKFPDFKDAEAKLRTLMIFDLDSEFQNKPENFIPAPKTAKKKEVKSTERTSLNGFLLILLLPLIYFILKKKNLTQG